jgi:hypothetical protein
MGGGCHATNYSNKRFEKYYETNEYFARVRDFRKSDKRRKNERCEKFVDIFKETL